MGRETGKQENEIKEMEIKLQNFHNRNVDEIREIKLEANNVVEKAILDTEKHIQEVRTYIYISVLPFHHSVHLFNVFMCFSSCLKTLLLIFFLILPILFDESSLLPKIRY